LFSRSIDRSCFLHLFGREAMERVFGSYLRTGTNDEEVYEEQQKHDAAKRGVKEWVDGRKKRHAQHRQALQVVCCASVTQIRFGWAGRQSGLRSAHRRYLILVATPLHI
jgi:hypothetical protein